jgi:hypothetical protein
MTSRFPGLKDGTRILVLVASLVGAAVPSTCRAEEAMSRPNSLEASAAAVEYIQQYRVHRVGNIGLSLTNWGRFGNFLRLGCCDYCSGSPPMSFDYPRGSGIDYLGEGGIWVGAVRGIDTIVSVTTDGDNAHTEFFPRPAPDGGFIERTSRPVLRADPPLGRCPDVTYGPDAVSEQDLITYYYDTITSPRFVWKDPYDARAHEPVGVEIQQKSYAWSVDYARNFILVDLKLRNVTDGPIFGLYIGLFMDQNVGHPRLTWGPNWDDITGFIRTVPSALVPGLLDTLNLAWTADEDGDPGLGRFQSNSPTGVAGIRVLTAPGENSTFSFNWWATNSIAARDWGPNKHDTKVVYRRGNLGTPLGDVCRYQVMANGEVDYDQIESALNHQVDGWLPPSTYPKLPEDLADGFDTRYLLSFGPFDVLQDSSVEMTYAFVAGEDFHVDARNFRRYFDPLRPDLYRDHLDFSSFIRNAQWAGWVYDTPGYDTDGDGFRGEWRIVGRDTVYYRGDGVPDFKGPPAPPAPETSFKTSEGRVIVRWNGERSETTIDYFSGLVDFEGYRVYMSRTGLVDDFALLSQRDRIDYVAYQYRPSYERWTIEGRPLTLDSLRSLYDDLVDSVYNFRPFHPDSFKVADVARAMRVVAVDSSDMARLDTNYFYFAPYSANQHVNDTDAATLADCCGSEVVGIIRKRFPFAVPGDTIYEDGVAYPAYYEYEYSIDGLQTAEPIFLSVTAFDFGDPKVGLDPLETSPSESAREVWPINSAQVVDSLRPKPGVYPNPYRLADNYNGNLWEDPRREGLDPERARKVTFTNVPDTCTISIYSLDGDLVRRLEHAADPASSEASVVVWNMITRNTQAIKTGIYLYAIESRYGTDVGKLVVIK